MKKLWRKAAAALTAIVAACSFLAMPVSAGWKYTDNGWWYQNEDGSYPYDGWASISGKWYYFDSEGYMLTGWLKVNNVWYYLNPDGDMATGWKQIGGSWYYFENWGGMVTGTKTIGGKTYTFKDSGAWTGNSSSSSSSSSGITTAPASEKAVVYWGVTGTKYHIDPYCRSFKGTAANSGTLEQAKAAGREDWCGICSKGWTDDRLLEHGNPYRK